MFDIFSVHYQSITKYRFGRPAADGNLLYETCVIWKIASKINVSTATRSSGHVLFLGETFIEAEASHRGKKLYFLKHMLFISFKKVVIKL